MLWEFKSSQQQLYPRDFLLIMILIVVPSPNCLSSGDMVHKHGLIMFPSALHLQVEGCAWGRVLSMISLWFLLPTAWALGEIVPNKFYPRLTVNTRLLLASNAPLKFKQAIFYFFRSHSLKYIVVLLLSWLWIIDKAKTFH